MSETRPRPRPRPRPRAKPAATDASSSSSTTQVQDEDALFMRNTTRTSTTWKALEQLDRSVSAKSSRNEDHEDGSSSPKRKNKRKSDETLETLRSRIVSTELSSDEDIEIVSVSPSKKSPRKRSRISHSPSRSRSRSITPPPALPMHQIQTARNVVQKALARPRSPSPIVFEEEVSTDTIALDPELARIAEAARSKAKLYQTNGRVSSIFIDDEAPLHTSGTITICVRWRPHPLNTAAQPQIWAFKLHRDGTFHRLFDEIADAAGVRTENLIVTYDDKRVFASSTPDALDMPPEADLVGCDVPTYEYSRKHQRSSSLARDDLSHDDAVPHLPQSRGATAPPHSDNESDNESIASNANTFKLIVRSRLTGEQEFTLTVRPTTKCGAIVKAFLKRAGLSDRYPMAGEAAPPPTSKKKGRASTAAKDPRLSVDGDIADNGAEIETFDLDEGDQVEIVGL
ncbi:hypothetical protein ONZ45_g2400 [Pleurotus djamor]|nr:hypothetical protein ONZ45_g2400 [Pleurotus djamor]